MVKNDRSLSLPKFFKDNLDEAMTGLGFSDLTEDEALLITLYREWLGQYLSRDTFELKMSFILASDAMHPVIDDVFAIFRHITTDMIYICGVGDLLCDHEELVLDAVSAHLSTVDKKADQNKTINVRSTEEISHTGRDALRSRVNQSSWLVAINL
ncbi:MAG: hypothetical protein OSA51_13185 [Octadecabacter sp.]|nr:hypothetical protein [Octadecabacter sp.]